MNGKRVDDGVLLLVAKNDRRVRIEVGYGLEGVLPDATCNRIIDETIMPPFRQGNYYGGIEAGLDQAMKLIQGEALPPPEQGWQAGRGAHAANLLPLLFIAVLIGSVVLRAMFGRTLGSAFTGLGAGVLVWLAAQRAAAGRAGGGGGVRVCPAHGPGTRQRLVEPAAQRRLRRRLGRDGRRLWRWRFRRRRLQWRRRWLWRRRRLRELVSR